MKNISLAFVFYVCSGHCIYGQTQTLSDVVVAGQKATVQGFLATEIVLKNRQRNLMASLKAEEDNYADKRGGIGNISNSMVYLALGVIMTSMENKIAATEYNIYLVKIQKLGLMHGLKGYQSELANEKRYFSKLKGEYALLNQCMLVSGGSGYNYTAFLKLLLRTMEIRKNVLLINEQVKSLMNASIILAR